MCPTVRQPYLVILYWPKYSDLKCTTVVRMKSAEKIDRK